MEGLKMIKLREARITDAIPAAAARQPWVKALSETWLALAQSALMHTDTTRLYTNIDGLSETLLDALAIELRTPNYNESYDIEKKRAIIKESMPYYNTMGTKEAVVNVIRGIYGQSAVEEWFEYNGTPGCFRIRIEPERAMDVLDCLERIEHAKRASAKLDELDIFTRESASLFTGFASITVNEFGTDSEEVVLDFDWFTEENELVLLDEAGSLLTDADELASD